MLIDNKKTSKIGDTPKETMTSGSKLSVVSGLFSIYVFAALKKELLQTDNTRLLLTQLCNTNIQSKLIGDKFEIRLRNQLNQFGNDDVKSI